MLGARRLILDLAASYSSACAWTFLENMESLRALDLTPENGVASETRDNETVLRGIPSCERNHIIC